MTVSWRDIEQRLGFPGAEQFARAVVAPHLSDIVPEPPTENGTPGDLQLPMGVAFAMFIVAFLIVGALLPDNWAGEVLKFILFPLLFLGALGGSVYLFKNRFLEMLTRGQERFILRSKALTQLAEQLDLTYVPSPGGAPKLLKLMAAFPLAPEALREAALVLDDHGGMEAPLDIARRSGALVDAATVIGSREQKEKYFVQQASYQQVEDGFQGKRGDLSFSAFEWIESVDDAPNVYHLALVLAAPTRLCGLTQFRSKGTGWPGTPTDQPLKKVSLGSSDFDARFRLRSTDQVEARVIFNPAVIERVIAFAHGEKVRAVAFEDHLVFDVAGSDRFALVDLVTGAWSDQSIRETFVNVAELLELVDAIAHAFMLRGDR